MARVRSIGASMPSKREMQKMDAEMMAKREIVESPTIKKMIAQKAREILKAVNGKK